MKIIVIDGHNLIPKLPRINLKDLDDESQLIGLIQEYCRLARKQAELFFDGAPNPINSIRKGGLVRAHFIRVGHSADDSIIAYLQRNGKNARNMLVITSDRRIQTEAKNLGAELMTSESFAQEIKRVLSSPIAVQELKEKIPSAGEVEEWIHLFDQKTGKK
ncbi:MAG: hypothetical protein FD147_715 [Chloroflexi bacterium]|nr:MAG: hypothetical protein FD147_715 [Chloroflexota bacterium]